VLKVNKRCTSRHRVDRIRFVSASVTTGIIPLVLHTMTCWCGPDIVDHNVGQIFV